MSARVNVCVCVISMCVLDSARLGDECIFALLLQYAKFVGAYKIQILKQQFLFWYCLKRCKLCVAASFLLRYGLGLGRWCWWTTRAPKYITVTCVLVLKTHIVHMPSAMPHSVGGKCVPYKLRQINRDGCVRGHGSIVNCLASYHQLH